MTPLQSVTKGPSTLHQKAESFLPLSSLSVAGPIDVLKPEDAMNILVGPKFFDCGMESRTKKESSNSIAIPSSCHYSEVTETVKEKSEAISLPLCYNGNCSTNKDLRNSPAIAINCSIEPSSLNDVCTAEKTSIKVEGFSSKQTDAAADDSKRKIDTVSAVLPNIPACGRRSTKEAKNVHDALRISIKNTWVGLGPSSSEKLKAVTVGGSAHTPEKGLKHRKGEKVNVEKSSVRISSKVTSGNTVDRKFRERVDKHGPVLATVDEFEKISSGSLWGSLSDNKGEISSIDGQRSPTQNGFTNMDCQRGLRQNGFVHMLMRCLSETTIARWDGVESTPVRMMESNVKKSVSIGYVADEWDEEYDRGKRKKVRMPKDKFDGQNPFQEIATKKAKLNDAKLDQSRSDNRPFRIF